MYSEFDIFYIFLQACDILNYNKILREKTNGQLVKIKSLFPHIHF